jgi:hypothetical protein
LTRKDALSLRRYTDAREAGMLFSPELDELKAQIGMVILRESEDFFDEPKDLAVLQVTIRIACEFFDFLKGQTTRQHCQKPITWRIQFGLGLTISIRRPNWGNILTGLELRKGFAQNVPSTLSEMKELHDSVFQQLTRCTSSAKGVGLLLSLVQIMLFS